MKDLLAVCHLILVTFIGLLSGYGIAAIAADMQGSTYLIGASIDSSITFFVSSTIIVGYLLIHSILTTCSKEIPKQ